MNRPKRVTENTNLNPDREYITLSKPTEPLRPQANSWILQENGISGVISSIDPSKLLFTMSITHTSKAVSMRYLGGQKPNKNYFSKKKNHQIF